MSYRTIALCCAALLGASPVAATDYRGMPAGWPYNSGYSAGYAPANYASPGLAYAARPVTVAYANPGYQAAYGNATTAYRPTVAAAGYYQRPPAAYYAPAYGAAPVATYYQPQAAYYQPQTAYYPPAYAPYTAQYAPSQSYAISPAGGSSAGSEAAAYYGQPMQLNYVPPQFSYRTNYAQVPVYAYRPVTAYYQPAGQPTTCLQPQTTSTCQPQRSRSWFSWLHPHNWGHSWFGGGGQSSCGYRGCGSPPPTTAYCQPACVAPQPYYPVQVQPAPAVIPTYPAQPQGIPLGPYPGPSSTVIPSMPSAGPRMPSPPTRTLPADIAPRLPTGSVPATTVPSTPGGFTPGTLTPSPGGFTPSGPGGFSTPPAGGGGSFPGSPNTSIQGGSSRSSTVSTPTTTNERPVIRAPELNAPLPPSVQTVPDLDAKQPVSPINRAPQLLLPRDKTATHGDQRWAVVPAVWPSNSEANLAARSIVQTKATEKALPAPAPSAARYDDSGWSSGR